MNRLLSLSVTAMFAVAVMGLSSTVASAQGLLWSPAINDIFAETVIDKDSAITKVQARRRGARRGTRRGVRRRVRRGGNAAAAAGIMGAIVGAAIIADQRNRHSYRRSDRRYRHSYRRSDRRYRRPPRRRVRRAGGHESWCYSRYRSYRAWDNTYQPYNGRRRQCISPYN